MKNKIKLSIDIFLDLIFMPLIFFVVLINFLTSKKNKKEKILFGLIPNNNLLILRDAIKKLGLNAKVIPLFIPAHEKQLTYDLDFEEKFPILYKNYVSQKIIIYFFFLYSLFKFDVFVISLQNRFFDRMFFLKWIEFQILKLCNKFIILNPYGGDIQYNEKWKLNKSAEFEELYKVRSSHPLYSKISDKFVKKNTKYCLNFANKVLLSLDWPLFIPKNKKNIYFHLRCIPQNLDKIKIRKKKCKEILIVHATNHPEFKGTKFLKSAVEEINNQKKLFKLVIYQNIEKEKLLSLITQADLVFDQILLGSYGRLALEAMALGKPVMSYMYKDFYKIYPHWHKCPIINVNLSNLKNKLTEFSKFSKRKKESISSESIQFTNKYYSGNYVANKFNDIVYGLE